jgi:hypothetical protein
MQWCSTHLCPIESGTALAEKYSNVSRLVKQHCVQHQHMVHIIDKEQISILRKQHALRKRYA